MWRRIDFIAAIIRKNLLQWFAVSCGFTATYYLVLMLGLIFRFGSLPNYVNSYDWIGNVQTIIRSTPSTLDTLKIINNEWIFEIGFMNYDFGLGISEWSLFLAPVKILGVFALGNLIATNYLILRPEDRICTDARAISSRAASGLGAVCVALASVTMSWVVCCSTPTWVVGLAMMGLGVSTSLWLEPMGFWVNLLGFSMLLVAIFTAAGRDRSSLVVDV